MQFKVINKAVTAVTDRRVRVAALKPDADSPISVRCYMAVDESANSSLDVIALVITALSPIAYIELGPSGRPGQVVTLLSVALLVSRRRSRNPDVLQSKRGLGSRGLNLGHGCRYKDPIGRG